MSVRSSMPVVEREATAYRALAHWADESPVDVRALAALGTRVALVDRRGSWTYRELASATNDSRLGCIGRACRRATPSWWSRTTIVSRWPLTTP